MSISSEAVPVKSSETPRSSSSSAVKRKSARSPETSGSVRYFLARDGETGDLPQLGKEFSKENEVLLEAMRTGLNYFAVSEWKSIPDFTGKNPQIFKQAVVPKPPHS